MTESPDPHRQRPRSDTVVHPTTWPLRRLRPLAALLLRLAFRIRVHHADRVPMQGPVIYAANHVGFADGPLLAIFAPQPVHALTKVEMFRGFLGRFLRFAGQIPLNRFEVDPGSVRTSLRVLRDGHALGIFPEGARGDGEFRRMKRGAAYYALATGAPVVPVIFIGTRRPGGGSWSLPPLWGEIDIVFGEPFLVPQQPWPRTQAEVRRVSMKLWEHLSETLEAALEETGRSLPGPLPWADQEPEPGGLEEESA